MEKALQEKIGQIQLLQQNLQNFASQRQQFQVQESEIDSALSEIDKSPTAYKIIGNIMVLMDKDALKKELEEKKQMMKVRISSIEKQESKLQEKAEALQKEVMKEIEKKNDSKQA